LLPPAVGSAGLAALEEVQRPIVVDGKATITINVASRMDEIGGQTVEARCEGRDFSLLLYILLGCTSYNDFGEGEFTYFHYFLIVLFPSYQSIQHGH
jgi:hypothetical protein